MSKKFEICSATYNIALNQDEDDVFRTGCAHLYHFLHGNDNNGRSTERKPVTLKMHLEIIEETEGQIAEPSNSNNPERQFIQQLEAKFQSLENSSQAKDDIVNKLIDRMEQHEKNLSNVIVNKLTDVGNNTIDQESINALLSSSEKFARQTSQLEKEIKALKDCIEKLVNNKADNETADIGNPTTHDNSTDKQQHQTNKHNSSQEPLNNENNGRDDHNDGKEYQMTPKEKQGIQFDRDNFVTIWFIISSDSSLETAIHNVIQYAKEMDLSLTRDQIKHIDVRIIAQDRLVYYVFFRTRAIKETFLMKSDILTRFPHNLEIYNVSEYNCAFIRNFKSLDLSQDRAIVDVIGLAKQMGLTLIRDEIRGVDVFRVNKNCPVCRVMFSTTQLKDEFLKKSHILKGLPETKSLEIY